MNWNTASFTNFGYPLSVKGSAWQDDPMLDGASAKEFSKLFLQVFEKRNKPRRDIQAAIQKWPDLPHFQFLLAECMYLEGQSGEEVILRMRQEHPSYLFSRVMDLYAYTDDQIEDVEFALGDGKLPTLPELYPERTVFHAFEVHQYEVAASYYIAHHEDGDVPTSDTLFFHGVSLFFNKREFTMAVSMDIVGRVRNPVREDEEFDDDEYDDDDEPEGGNLGSFTLAEVDTMANRLREPKELPEYAGDHKSALLAREDAQMAEIMAIQMLMTFEFELVKTDELYDIDHEFPDGFLDKYLAEPRGTLVRDLITLLDFAPNDYDQQYPLPFPTWAPLHAIFMLTELKAEEAIGPLMTFFALPRPVVNYYLGSFLQQEVSERLSLLLEEDWNAMDDLLFNTEAWTTARIQPLRALAWLGYRYAFKHKEIEDHLIQMLMLVNGLKDPAIEMMNSEFILLAIDGRFPRLMKRIYAEFGKTKKLLKEDKDMAADAVSSASFPRKPWSSDPNDDGSLAGFYRKINTPLTIPEDYIAQLAKILAEATRPK